MRPRPGAARMYPETDIPPTQITEDLVKRANLLLPELPEQKLKRLMKDYGLNKKLAKQILDSEYSELFETIIKESDVSPITVTAFLTETLRALKRDGVQVDNVSEKQIREVFKQVGTGELTKEAIPEVVSWLSKHEDKDIQEAISSLGLKILSEEELMKIVDDMVENNKKIVKERGMEAFGPLMSLVMKEVRGKANAALVGELIRKKLKQIN